MKFIANNVETAIVETEQVNDAEVVVTLDGTTVAYFDSDENEFVVYQDTLKNKFNITVSVEDQQV